MGQMRKIVNKAIGVLERKVRKVRSRARMMDDLEMYSRLYGDVSVRDRRFYNVGAGGFLHSAWTNIDFESDWYGDTQSNNVHINYDLFSLKPIPVEDESAEVVYTSHTIEHINDESAQNLFNESYRMLKEGGCFRVTTPDIRLLLRAYRDNDFDFFYFKNMYSAPENYKKIKLSKPLTDASIQELLLYYTAATVNPMHTDGAAERVSGQELDRIFQEMDQEAALDYITSMCPLELQRKYPGSHMNWWGAEKLVEMLQAAGFEDIYTSGYGQSHCPVLRNISFFDSTHPKLSLYVEAKK